MKNGVYRIVKEEMCIVCKVQRRKAGWIGHILHRNGLLKYVKYVIAGKTEGRKKEEEYRRYGYFKEDTM